MCPIAAVFKVVCCLFYLEKPYNEEKEKAALNVVKQKQLKLIEKGKRRNQSFRRISSNRNSIFHYSEISNLSRIKDFCT